MKKISIFTHSPRRLLLGATWALSLTALALSTASCGSDPNDARTSASVRSGVPSDQDPRPDTKEACDACGGLWKVHGFLPFESCVCATSDAGKSCTDGAQCEGACIVDDEEFQVVDPGPPALGYRVGRCAAYDTTFGCYLVIQVGTASGVPRLFDDAVARLCVD